MEKRNIDEILEEEKANPLLCPKCHGALEISYRKSEQGQMEEHSLCPVCDSDWGLDFTKKVEQNRMLEGSDFVSMKKLPKEFILRILKLRETRYNYLWHEWQESAKGNQKTEFFMRRMNELKDDCTAKDLMIIHLKEKLKKAKHKKAEGVKHGMAELHS